MTLHTTPEQTPAGPDRPDRRTVIALAVLVGAAMPLIVIAGIWPSYGAACALLLATLVAAVQLLRDRHQ